MTDFKSKIDSSLFSGVTKFIPSFKTGSFSQTWFASNVVSSTLEIVTNCSALWKFQYTALKLHLENSTEY